MLFLALGDAKVPDARYFAFWWNIGLSLTCANKHPIYTFCVLVSLLNNRFTMLHLFANKKDRETVVFGAWRLKQTARNIDQMFPGGKLQEGSGTLVCFRSCDVSFPTSFMHGVEDHETADENEGIS